METMIQNPFEQIARQNAEILERLKRIEKQAGINIPHQKPKFYNIEDVMRITDWTKATIYGKTHRREIPVTKAGKRLLFPVEAFESFLESKGQPVKSK